MTPFFANYEYHPQTKWMKEREIHNPQASMYVHWMQMIYENAIETIARTKETMR